MTATVAASGYPLVAGSLEEYYRNKNMSSMWVQVLSAKITDNSVKVAVSDSQNIAYGIFQAPLRDAFVNGTLKENCIINLTSFSLTTRMERVFLIARTAELSTAIHCTERVGSPVHLSASTVAPSASTNATSGGNTGSASATAFHSNVSSVGANNSGAASHSDEQAPIHPISTISPYNNVWTIKARVANKSDVKTFRNDRGEGKLFSATMVDQSGEIRITAFGEAVDKFFDLIQVGQVYQISQGHVVPARKQFGVSNDYEIRLSNDTIISLVLPTASDSLTTIPHVRYDFVPISSIETLERDATCDVLGVVTEATALNSIVTKAQKTVMKRDLQIMDRSGCSIRITLWDTMAESFDDSAISNGQRPIMAVKGARVSDYNHRTLSTSFSCTVTFNPDIPEAHALRGWYDSEGCHLTGNSLSVSPAGGSAAAGGAGTAKADERCTIAEIKDKVAALDAADEKGLFFNLLGTVTFMKADASFCYAACPSEGCSRKVFDEGNNMFHCEKCAKNFDRCEYRYVLNVQVSDETGTLWVSLFNEGGEVIMKGKKAEELMFMRDTDSEQFHAFIKGIFNDQYLFRLRGRQEAYNGEVRSRFQVMSVLPVNPENESRIIIDQLMNI